MNALRGVELNMVSSDELKSLKRVCVRVSDKVTFVKYFEDAKVAEVFT
jgi:hypothetical protein